MTMSDHESAGTEEPERPDQRERPEQPDDMREADVVNGEDPDVAGGHRTGDEAASRNRENDPPA